VVPIIRPGDLSFERSFEHRNETIPVRRDRPRTHSGNPIRDLRSLIRLGESLRLIITNITWRGNIGCTVDSEKRLIDWLQKLKQKNPTESKSHARIETYEMPKVL